MKKKEIPGFLVIENSVIKIPSKIIGMPSEDYYLVNLSGHMSSEYIFAKVSDKEKIDYDLNAIKILWGDNVKDSGKVSEHMEFRVKFFCRILNFWSIAIFGLDLRILDKVYKALLVSAGGTGDCRGTNIPKIIKIV